MIFDDIFLDMFLSHFSIVWGHFRYVEEEFLMVWMNFCIVFSNVVDFLVFCSYWFLICYLDWLFVITTQNIVLAWLNLGAFLFCWSYFVKLLWNFTNKVFIENLCREINNNLYSLVRLWFISFFALPLYVCYFWDEFLNDIEREINASISSKSIIMILSHSHYAEKYIKFLGYVV